MHESLAVRRNCHNQQLPVERRRHRRIKVELPISFPGGKGLTKNISVGGVYFESENVDVFFSREEVPVEIRFELNGPGGKVTYITTVLRVEKLGKGARRSWGVALAFKEAKTSLSFSSYS